LDAQSLRCWWRNRAANRSHRKADAMSNIQFRASTTATADQFVSGLTDFGPGRSKIFAKSADDYLQVHSSSGHEADVTEGSGGVWERLHYDWSDPNHVTLTTTDSNVFGGTSGYVYTLIPQPDGTTLVEVTIVREGKNFRGRVLSAILGTVGKNVLRKAFVNSVKAIEARSQSETQLP
jgi:hypothetical protein